MGWDAGHRHRRRVRGGHGRGPAAAEAQPDQVDLARARAGGRGLGPREPREARGELGDEVVLVEGEGVAWLVVGEAVRVSATYAT